MKIKLFVVREIQYFQLGIFSFNSYVYYLTCSFIASIHAFNLLTRAFNLSARAFNLATQAFSVLTRDFEIVTRRCELVTRRREPVICRSMLATRGFEVVTRRFELAIRGFELVTRRFERVTRGFKLVTCILLFHIKNKAGNELQINSNLQTNPFAQIHLLVQGTSYPSWRRHYRSYY